MSGENQALRTGKSLQLLIAAARDLPTTLAPLRAARLRRQTRLAASLGGATTAVVGGALWASSLGFWASLGTALGLGSLPLLITLAGAGGLALGLPRRRSRRPEVYQRQRGQIELSYCCFQVMARADGRVSEEEQLILRSVLLQFPLEESDRESIATASADSVLAGARALEEPVRRQVLQGTWMLAETDGVSPEEERVFDMLAERLGLAGETQELRRQSRDLQNAVNDLAASMFRSCQQVLSPCLGQPAANEFLEALAQIAATPQVRRSLRNSLRSGFSPGGVARSLIEHPESAKLIAQCQNAVRAVCSSADEQRQARHRLLELAESSEGGTSSVKQICADVDALFDESLAAAVRAES